MGISGEFDEYLLSFNLKPGSYRFSQIIGRYDGFLVRAMCQMPLNLKFDIKPSTVVYLGNIDAVIRERKSDEERAGGLFPLVDQAAAGFSNGTFDVTVRDRFEEDMKAYLSEYPGLQKVKVEKALLPEWVRPEKLSTQ